MALQTAVTSLTRYNRLLATRGKYKVVDIFPYKIKERARFVNRNHIPYNKESPQAKAYAIETWRRMVEGLWVEDADGTQVYMLPNVFFFANLGTISLEDEDKNRYLAPPDLRDNEWIINTYLFCCDGFSGFENDPDFTCNLGIKSIEENKPVSKKAMARMEKYGKRADGSWKSYINPWEYLTWFYTLEQGKRGIPLGLPLYQNPSSNGCILSSRKVSKTFNLAAADCTRIFLTNGVKRATMLKKNPQINMFVGAVDSIFVDSFVKAAEVCIRNLPGAEKGAVSPYYRENVGPWTSDRDPIIQGYRTSGAGSEVSGSNSMIAKAILTGGKGFAVVSKRYIRIYEDEGGLDPNSDTTMNAADASLKADKGPSGSYIISGTGGNVKVIGKTKSIMNNPAKFRVFAIPNYWDQLQDMGLFMPVSYSYADYKDPQGNTEVVEATDYCLSLREDLSGGDEDKITDIRANEPLMPNEMFLAGGVARFSVDLINDRIDVLEADSYREFKKVAKVYELELGKKLPNFGFEVKATAVDDRWHNVILSNDRYMSNGKRKTGELVVLEPPIPDGEGFSANKSTYKVVYDPHSDLPTGESDAAIRVYKGVPKNRPWQKDEMVNNVVAFFNGRLGEDEEHMLFMLLCLWYGCRGQYERNIGGVRGFFKRYHLVWLLQEPPFNTIKDISPSSQQQQSSGIVMSDNAVSGGLKTRATEMLQVWHRGTAYIDEGAKKVFTQVEISYDLPWLYEMLNYNDSDNFDSISAYRVLMVWLKDENRPLEDRSTDTADFKDDDYDQLDSISDEILYING